MTRFNHFAVAGWFMAWIITGVTGTALASEDPERTSLRADAVHQLEMAVSAVDEATRRKALWIPAKEALDEATQAFARGDFEQAIVKARTAKRFAELGIRQLEYPPYRHF